MNAERAASPGAHVRVTARPLWRIRLQRELPRRLVAAAATLGLLASARYTIDPPRPLLAPPAPAAPQIDRAAEGYAVLFARRYLSWSSGEPQASARELEPFTGQALEPGAGLVLPPRGQQRVEWAEVVQSRELPHARATYTVAALTSAAGLVYLSVSVDRLADGRLALAGYPAFVGPPAAGPAEPPRLPEAGEPALAAVADRALRNYLAGSGEELAADLAPGAQISLPPNALTLLSVQRLQWAEPRRALLATLQARDAGGTEYELAYELDVTQRQGRWEVTSIQTNPDS